MNHIVNIIFLVSFLFPSIRYYDKSGKNRFMADGILICLINCYLDSRDRE